MGIICLLCGFILLLLCNKKKKHYPPTEPKVVEYWPGTKIPKEHEWVISGEASDYMDAQEKVLRERALYTIAHNKVTVEGGTHYIDMEVMRESVTQALKELSDEQN